MKPRSIQEYLSNFFVKYKNSHQCGSSPMVAHGVLLKAGRRKGMSPFGHFIDRTELPC